ncbi:MAG: pyridoxal phosphate-dependent aminotransferase [Chitinophagaceae bacterium]|nr:MAG: pyridoxal phosphate-dependent aminotransferase [Chitinophagaceae bacterium]
MQLSSRLQRFNEPETLKMAKLGRELRAKGIDVIDLSLGEPDFDTPDHIKESAKKAIDENWSHYTPVAGYLDLREAVCTKLKRDNNLDYKPENILVSTGAKQSLANVIMAVIDNGDEVVIPTPFWVTYSELVRITEGTPVFVRSTVENNYKITPAQLEAAITPKTKLFMFSSPCNPSGAVYSKEELAGLAEVFRKYPDIFIISDEIYEYINYVGEHESIAQFDDLKSRIIIVNGLSKGFAMTGWRLGYIAADPIVVKGAEKIQGQFTSATSSITQRAAIIALTGDLTTCKEMTAEFTNRRKKMLELMATVPGVTCSEPEGAFYVFPVMKAYYGKKVGEQVINNSDDLTMYLLNTAHVSSVSGNAFGEPDSIRLSFATSMKNIENGVDRIRKALAALS